MIQHRTHRTHHHPGSHHSPPPPPPPPHVHPPHGDDELGQDRYISSTSSSSSSWWWRWAKAGQVLPGLVTSHPVYVHTDRARCTPSTKLQNIAKYHTIVHTDRARGTSYKYWQGTFSYGTSTGTVEYTPVQVLALCMLHLRVVSIHMLHILQVQYSDAPACLWTSIVKAAAPACKYTYGKV